jgi:DNA polymerase-4
MHNPTVIFHVDMDAFFASVEQRDNPAWCGLPVIVGAEPGKRGVVCAASYEARTFGVRSAMPISEATARCPNGIFVRPRMAVYSAESRRLMALLNTFSPIVEPISVDEAFVDMSGTAKLWGPPDQAAAAIARNIRDTLQLTGSIGIAPNKFLAKLASDCNKPNGITQAPFEAAAIIAWLAPMPVSRIWGVGEKMTEVLSGWGIHTIGQMQQLTNEELQHRFGLHGNHLYALCRGIDSRTVGPAEQTKSISREHTFNKDCADRSEWQSVLLSLTDDVARQARSEGLRGRTVFLTFRKPDFSRHTRRATQDQSVGTAKEIYEIVLRLLDEAAKTNKKFRLIGVGVTNFSETMQTNLFGSTANEAWEVSETAMDGILARYGDTAIFRGGEKRERRKRPTGL